MPELQRDLSELLRKTSTDKPRHAGDKSMDGKFQGIMHKPYNFMFRMVKKWRDAIDLEIEQIKEYEEFKDLGNAVYENSKVTNAPKEYQKIRVHLMFDVKHCGKIQGKTCGRWISHQRTQ